MKIKKITSRNRRDFSAIYICEHCEHEKESYGYDDSNFHENVIPNMVCGNCDKKSPTTYIPNEPKYKASEVI